MPGVKTRFRAPFQRFFGLQRGNGAGGSPFFTTLLGEAFKDLEIGVENDDPYYDGDEPEDFLQDFNGTEYLRLAPTMDFSPDEDLVRDTGWVEWSYPDDDQLEALREEAGFVDT
mgnify:CR=1 FL=1